MTFLNPVMLFGLLGVGLPILIHLLSRPRVREVRWAAMRFLIDSLKKNSRRLQVEDLLLLIVRCLLVAILALLFARPAWLIHKLGLGPETTPSTTVLVLDNSESMGQTDGIHTRFELAKQRAEELLAQLPSGAGVALYLVSDRARALVPKPTTDLSLVRRQLDLARLTDGSTDLSSGVRVAADVLRTMGKGECRLVVFTDSQVPAWGDLEKIRQIQEEGKGHFTIRVSVLGDHGEDNLAVSSLQLVGKVAAVDQPLHCSVTVTNWSRGPATKVVVKLAADNGAPQDQTTIDQIDPGASKVVRLTARFQQPGYHSLTAIIPSDRLPADDQRSTVLRVIEKVRVLVVAGASHDGLFLSEALAPVARAERENYYLKVTSINAPELDTTDFGKDDVVVLSNVGKLSPTTTQNLDRYVNQGGALVIFPGPLVNPDLYNNDPSLQALLPAKLNAAENAPANQQFLTLQSPPYAHPIATLWNNPEDGSLNSVRITRYFPLVVPPGGATRVVLKYSNDQPAAVEQQVGRGRVILFGSTATTAWETLPIHPAFIPLLARVISYAIGSGDEALNLRPGDSFAYNVDSEYEGQDFSVQAPGDKTPRPVGKVDSGEASGAIHYGDTDRSGVYQVFIGDEAKPKVAFAVQADPAESNLAQEAPAEIDSLINPPPVTAPEPSGEQKPGIAETVPGQEIWLSLALAFFVLVVLDTAMAHLFSQAR